MLLKKKKTHSCCPIKIERTHESFMCFVFYRWRVPLEINGLYIECNKMDYGLKHTPTSLFISLSSIFSQPVLNLISIFLLTGEGELLLLSGGLPTTMFFFPFSVFLHGFPSGFSFKVGINLSETRSVMIFCPPRFKSMVVGSHPNLDPWWKWVFVVFGFVGFSALQLLRREEAVVEFHDASEVKLILDAISTKNKEGLGVGAVTRDPGSKVVAALAEKMPSFFQVDICEALTLKEGLLFAIQLELKVI